MQITSANIQELYQFVASQDVKHYDLQTELVDHLANGIEKQWITHPEKSFEEIKIQEFQKFGAEGFSDVIDTHNRALSKKYKKIILGFFMEYFELPKIIGTVSSIAIIFYCLRFLPENPYICSIFTISFFMILLVLTIVLSHINNKIIYKRKIKRNGKRWKLEDMIFHTHVTYRKSKKRRIVDFIIMAIPVILVTVGDEYISSLIPPFVYNHYWVQLVVAITIVLISLLTYIDIVILPEKVEELLEKTYPEYELLK